MSVSLVNRPLSDRLTRTSSVLPARSHYQTELGAANEAFSNDILERGIIADADLPGFG